MKFSMKKKSKSKAVKPFESSGKGSPFGKGVKAAFNFSSMVKKKKKKK